MYSHWTSPVSSRGKSVGPSFSLTLGDSADHKLSVSRIYCAEARTKGLLYIIFSSQA